jgi:hypothetical protein
MSIASLHLLFTGISLRKQHAHHLANHMNFSQPASIGTTHDIISMNARALQDLTIIESHSIQAMTFTVNHFL